MEPSPKSSFEILSSTHPKIASTEHISFTLNKTRISLCQRDMTIEETDAIINPANKHLAHGGGLARAISVKGGPEINEESRKVIETQGEVPIGGCVHTTAGDMPSKYVIHTVGPRWYNYDNKPEARKLLRSCVKNVYHKANELGIKNYSFPPVSSGIFQYPKELCAEDILWELYRVLKEERKEEDTVDYIRVTMIGDEGIAKFLPVFKEVKKTVEENDEDEDEADD